VTKYRITSRYSAILGRPVWGIEKKDGWLLPWLSMGAIYNSLDEAERALKPMLDFEPLVREYAR